MTDLTRRDLLRRSAAVLALPAALAPWPAGPPHRAVPPRAPKKAVKWYMIGPGKTVLEKFELLQKLGFDGVELDSPGILARDEVLAAKAKTGLEIPGVVDSVHWGKPLSHADPSVRAEGRAALETALRDCKAYGGSSVLLVPAVVGKDTFYGDAWQRSQAEIRKVLPLAAELQIQILIENVWNNFLLGPTELCRYVDELESPWVGVHFDPGNLVRFGWPEHWVPILGQRIKKVDVKDFRKKDHSFEVDLHDGDTDWPAVMAELAKVGYSGWFTAEMKGRADERWLAELGRRMDKFLKPRGPP